PVVGFAAARDVLTMGYVRQEQGGLVAAASCPVADCTSADYQQPPQPTNHSETLELATFDFQVRSGGTITLSIADVVLVDAQGVPLLSGNNGGGAAAVDLSALDLSRNNQINDADAALVISAWRELQRTGRCLAPAVTSYDVDGNGCLNVVDVQLIL